MKNKKGFTLIELLVVIAIIAVLMSIAAASLRKARELAKITICKSNQKSIGQACLTYAGSFNDQLVPGDMWNGLTIYHPVGPPWDSIGDPVNLGHLLDLSYLPLPTSQKHVIYCPSNREPYACYRDDTVGINRDFYHNWKNPTGSQIIDVNYTYRDELDGISDWNLYTKGTGAKMSRLSSSTPILADVWQWNYHKGKFNVLLSDTSVHNLNTSVNPGKKIVDKLWSIVASYPDESWYFMYLDDIFSNMRFVPDDIDNYKGNARIPDIKNEPKL